MNTVLWLVTGLGTFVLTLFGLMAYALAVVARRADAMASRLGPGFHASVARICPAPWGPEEADRRYSQRRRGDRRHGERRQPQKAEATAPGTQNLRWGAGA